MFGRPVPEEIIAERGQPIRYWGARAIFKPGTKHPIDLLPDRQSAEAREGFDVQRLLDWVNNCGLKELQRLEEFHRLYADSRDVVTFREYGFTLQACPNASHGYLYMGAWQYWANGCLYEQQQTDPAAKWSGKLPIPPIGAKVVCKNNGTWRGTVTSYFVEHGWQGIEIETTERPDWSMKQDPKAKYALLFGIEVSEVLQEHCEVQG